MRRWDDIWEEITKSEIIKEEYKKAFLLNLFQKIVSRMSSDPAYRNRVLTLFRQSSDTFEVTKALINKEYDYVLDNEETALVSEWFSAYWKKKNSRATIPLSVKKKLYNIQKGRCAVCGQELGSDWSKIHVDHIIPWALVGDELDNNYQDLCQTCNECKSAKVDYIFRSLIKLS